MESDAAMNCFVVITRKLVSNECPGFAILACKNEDMPGEKFCVLNNHLDVGGKQIVLGLMVL